MKTYVVLLIFLNLKVSWAEPYSQVDDICEEEIQNTELDGSCLLQGILSAKDDPEIHIKVETYCHGPLKLKLIKNYMLFKPFLIYYPKCKYIIERHLHSKL